MQFTGLDLLEMRLSEDDDAQQAYDACMQLPLGLDNVVSFDYGFWGVKAFGPAAPSGVTFRSLMGTRIGKPNLGNTLFGGTSNEIGLRNRVTGTDQLFGQAAENDAIATSLKEKSGADITLLQPFMMAALSRIVKPGNSRVWVVVGLPVRDVKNQKFVNEVKENLLGLHQFTSTDDAEFSVLVEKVNVQPQPAGALFDMVIGADGVPSSYMEAVRTNQTGVIATGGETAEVYVTRPVRDDDGNWRLQVDEGRSDTRHGSGIHLIHNFLLEKVWGGLDEKQRPSPVQIDLVLERGTWWDGTQDIDLADQIEAAKKHMVAEVLSLIKDTIGLDNVNLRYIALAGGSIKYVQTAVVEKLGAHRVYLPGQRPGLTEAENAELAANVKHPERIIARGLHRYGRYQMMRWLARQEG
jgi:hypothetical protein